MMTKIYSVPETARALGLEVYQIEYRIRKGHVPAPTKSATGKLRYFSEADFLKIRSLSASWKNPRSR